jgi:hypothetical protein
MVQSFPMTRAKASKLRQKAVKRPNARKPTRRQLEDAQDLKAARRARAEKGNVPIEAVLRRLAV